MKVTVTRIQKSPIGAMIVGKGQKVQHPFDKYGHSSISRVRIQIPWKVNQFEKGRSSLLFGIEETKFKDKEIAIEILNAFIEKTRYVLNAFWLVPVRYQDFSDYEISYLNGKTEYFTMRMLIGAGVGSVNITTNDPFHLEESKLIDLRTFLESEVEYDLSKIFLLNAKDACLEEDYRHALIEGVIALEIELYDFSRQRCKSIGISKKKLDGFIIDVGLKGNLSVVLKMLCEGVDLPADLMEQSKGAITIRNDIVHRGRREVHPTEAEEKIISIFKMVEFLKELKVQYI